MIIVYTSAEQMFVMTEEDEPEFIARYFDGTVPEDEEWVRSEVDGPVEISRPEMPDFHDVYESYEI
jgi:hypothetical protein